MSFGKCIDSPNPGGSSRARRRKKLSGRYALLRAVAGLVLLFVLSVGVKLDTSPPLVSPANIYLYDSLLLVSYGHKGVHVFSVSDPTNPRRKQTIPIKANSGVAMKDSILYANTYDAILAIRLYDDSLYEITSVIGDTNEYQYREEYAYYGGTSSLFGCGSTPVAMDSRTGGGTGGSYAIFAVIDSFLYYIDDYRLITMDITNPSKPREVSETYIDWSIETLFPTRSHLYIGGTTGMYVLDRSDPEHPVKVGTFSHIRSCDPVVVQDTIAYVTLRGGGTCGGSSNVLFSLSIADPAKPRELDQVSISSPYGLSLRDSLLYVGQDLNGFSLWDVSDPRTMTRMEQWNTPRAIDFIWDMSTLYVMGSDGVQVFDVTDPRTPVMQSELR